MKQVTVMLLDGYCLTESDYDDSYENNDTTLEGLAKQYFKDRVERYCGEPGSWTMTQDQFEKYYNTVSVYKSEIIKYGNHLLTVPNMGVRESVKDEFLVILKRIIQEHGSIIANSLIDLVPGMRVYTNSGTLKYLGKVLGNDGKYITVDFNGIVLDINDNGNVIGGGKYSKHSFSIDKPYNWQGDRRK